MTTREAVVGLDRHDLLVQFFRNNEDLLVSDGVLNADGLATLVESMIATVEESGAGHRQGH